jgi:OPA family glycerol-3-phosphate transporter-like MFS transporter
MKKKLQSQIVVRYFVVICWIAYFSTYLGRLNYVAAMNEMVRIGFLTKPEAGMIGTGFFFCYGIGQLFSGFLGDRVPSRWMCFVGIAGSAMINLAMAFTEGSSGMLLLWCINGFAQALTWAPIIKILSERLSTEQCKKASVTMTTTVAVGTISAYTLAALMIGVADWRGVFATSSLILGGVSLLWLFAIGRIEKIADTSDNEDEVTAGVNATLRENDTNVVNGAVPVTGNIWTLLLAMGVFPVMLCIVLQGILKDGVMTWVPTYISEIYQLGSVTSILASIMLPITNLGGVYAAYYLNSRYFKNEVKTSGVCFAITAGAILTLVLFGGNHVIIAVVALSITTSGMMGVNTMLISLLPLYFAKHNKVSTVTGILNSCAYAGSAVSSFGIGLIAQYFDWEVTIIIWFILALIGAAICLAVRYQWQKASQDKVLEASNEM